MYVSSCRTRVRLVFIYADSYWTRVDLCWLVSDSCLFVSDSYWFVLTCVDLFWYSCFRKDLIRLDWLNTCFWKAGTMSKLISLIFLNVYSTYLFLHIYKKSNRALIVVPNRYLSDNRISCRGVFRSQFIIYNGLFCKNFLATFSH